MNRKLVLSMECACCGADIRREENDREINYICSNCGYRQSHLIQRDETLKVGRLAGS